VLDFHVIKTIGQYTFLRIMTGWFLRLLGGGAVLVMIILFLGGPDPEEALISHRADVLDYILPLAGMLIVIVMGATEIPRDIDTRTIMILLSKPLTKIDYLLGKYVGLVYVAGVTVALMGVACIVGCAVQGMMPDWNILQKIVFAFLQAAIVAAVVITLSTRLNEIPIIFFAAGYAVLGFFIFYLHAFVMDPHFPETVKLVIRLIYYAVPNMRYFQIAPEEVSREGFVSAVHFFSAILYAAAYSAVALVLASRSFLTRHVAG
jgi:ABC-type transport system involved in multi-copper enzyme maturation permease subunit